ncbi:MULTISPECIES: surface-adhesin E family protein [Achromobacter]|uniref:Surface-adhesin protein E-like domain-containing protein n=1 Tax=Achromobacter spanius TaxID=217203 RepID=A0AAW3IB41_9BURK|nr:MULTISPECIES: surface-adhesin E family protein [Achromobacter]AZS79461.1 hypothetical protein ELS24_13980 [Achromobacter spanius]KNE29731.1 hypothetical protein AFM18_01720 [Achromobacter spanius]MCD0497435.1 hypothetical protein [Achromobacter sp. MY14]MCW3152705.1 hypothetical protein [Achromobacter spanius]
MIARHAPLFIALALLGTVVWVPLARAASPDVVWTPLDPQTMPGVFYDSASIARVSEKPVTMAVTVAWFYAQHRVSETTGQTYGSVAQPITLNCSADTYTVTETRHYAGNDATGALVESIPVAGIHNAPVARDPVQRKLRAVVCPAPGKSGRK